MESQKVYKLSFYRPGSFLEHYKSSVMVAQTYGTNKQELEDLGKKFSKEWGLIYTIDLEE